MKNKLNFTKIKKSIINRRQILWYTVFIITFCLIPNLSINQNGIIQEEISISQPNLKLKKEININSPNGASNDIKYALIAPEVKLTRSTNLSSDTIEKLDSTAPTLFLAKNESEFFHLAIEGPLEDVDVTFTTNFPGSIEFFQESFIHITTPGWDSFEGGFHPFLPVGKKYADGLVPFNDEFNSSHHPGKNFSVSSKNIGAILVKFSAPDTNIAGLYDTNITLTAKGKTPSVILIKSFVFNFTIPKETIDTAYYVEYGYQTIDMFEGVTEDSTEHQNLRLKYYEFLAKYGFTAANMRPRAGFDSTTGIVNMSAIGPIIEKLATYGLKSFEIQSYYDDYNGEFADGSTKTNFASATWNASAIKWYQGWVNWLDARGLLNNSYAFVTDDTEYVSDEPYHNGPTGYQQAWSWAHLLNEANPRIRIVMADNILPSSVQSNYLDLRKTNLNIIWDVYAADVDAPGLKPKLSELNTKGYDTWLVPNEHYDFIDYKGTQTRALGAYSFLYDFSGVEAWATISWPSTNTDPWVQNPYNEYGNGAGAIIYSGKHWDVNGPLSSFRLELNREMLDDHAYLTLASNLGSNSLAKNLAHNIIPGDMMGTTENQINSSHFKAFKLALAGEILRLSNPNQLSDADLLTLSSQLPIGFGLAPGSIDGIVYAPGGVKTVGNVQITDGISTATSKSNGRYSLSVLPGTKSMIAYQSIFNGMLYNTSRIEFTPTTKAISITAGQTIASKNINLSNATRKVELIDSFEINTGFWAVDGPGSMTYSSSFPSGINSTQGATMVKVTFDSKAKTDFYGCIKFTGDAGQNDDDELWIDIYTSSGNTYTLMELAIGEKWEYYRNVVIGPGGPYTLVIPLKDLRAKLGYSLASFEEGIPIAMIGDGTIGNSGQFETGERIIYFDNIRFVHSSVSTAQVVESSNSIGLNSSWLIIGFMGIGILIVKRKIIGKKK
jgi:hypothetical protein